MRNKEFIGRPIPGKKRKEGRQAPEPEPGTRRSQKITIENNPLPEKGKKEKGETNPGTLAGTRRKKEIMMEHNATILRRYYGDKPHNPSWNQMEPGHDDGTECQKTTETIPGTLPESKRTEEMMMEQNARILGTKKTWWNKTVSWKSWEPHSPPELFGQQARNPSRNQERMMEQSARRVGRQAPEP